MEWKYVRCQIWWEFFEDCRALPPPFCVLQFLVHGTVYALRKLTGDKNQRSAWDMNFIGRQETPSERKQYLLNAYTSNIWFQQELIRTLKGRLLRNKVIQQMTNMEHFPIVGLSAQLLNFRNAVCKEMDEIKLMTPKSTYKSYTATSSSEDA
ncbi:Transient receptor potential cation channel, subf amily C, member 3 [Trichuris trichiura]|uniref:Transient receptor potential cation channel, subf amily C, member 3 n=1 Tax=Trichuris trichiura TaxID=36087 RepID=A0A077ZCU2_TRITR|nr:Transient receptor potential cation channel, subf amily C, member 3 [Trichuris trichiura]